MKSTPRPHRRLVLCLLGSLSLTVACMAVAQHLYPDVIDVKVRASAPDTFDFDVTISSPYDTPSRYADGFRVQAPDGTVFGERKLWHDHQNEQPFTRDLYGVRIPKGVKKLVVQARDQRSGYGGKSLEAFLPGR